MRDEQGPHPASQPRSRRRSGDGRGRGENSSFQRGDELNSVDVKHRQRHSPESSSSSPSRRSTGDGSRRPFQTPPRSGAADSKPGHMRQPSRSSPTRRIRYDVKSDDTGSAPSNDDRGSSRGLKDGRDQYRSGRERRDSPHRHDARRVSRPPPPPPPARERGRPGHRRQNQISSQPPQDASMHLTTETMVQRKQFLNKLEEEAQRAVQHDVPFGCVAGTLFPFNAEVGATNASSAVSTSPKSINTLPTPRHKLRARAEVRSFAYAVKLPSRQVALSPDAENSDKDAAVRATPSLAGSDSIEAQAQPSHSEAAAADSDAPTEMTPQTNGSSTVVVSETRADQVRSTKPSLLSSADLSVLDDVDWSMEETVEPADASAPATGTGDVPSQAAVDTSQSKVDHRSENEKSPPASSGREENGSDRQRDCLPQSQRRQAGPDRRDSRRSRDGDTSVRQSPQPRDRRRSPQPRDRRRSPQPRDRRRSPQPRQRASPTRQRSPMRRHSAERRRRSRERGKSPLRRPLSRERGRSPSRRPLSRDRRPTPPYEDRRRSDEPQRAGSAKRKREDSLLSSRPNDGHRANGPPSAPSRDTVSNSDRRARSHGQREAESSQRTEATPDRLRRGSRDNLRPAADGSTARVKRIKKEGSQNGGDANNATAPAQRSDEEDKHVGPQKLESAAEDLNRRIEATSEGDLQKLLPKSADDYLAEAKRIKKKADAIESPAQRRLAYLRASVEYLRAIAKQKRTLSDQAPAPLLTLIESSAAFYRTIQKKGCLSRSPAANAANAAQSAKSDPTRPLAFLIGTRLIAMLDAQASVLSERKLEHYHKPIVKHLSTVKPASLVTRPSNPDQASQQSLSVGLSPSAAMGGGATASQSLTPEAQNGLSPAAVSAATAASEGGSAMNGTSNGRGHAAVGNGGGSSQSLAAEDGVFVPRDILHCIRQQDSIVGKLLRARESWRLTVHEAQMAPDSVVKTLVLLRPKWLPSHIDFAQCVTEMEVLVDLLAKAVDSQVSEAS